MGKSYFIIAAAVFVLAMTDNAQAASPNSAQINCRVYSPIGISKISDFNFGSIIAGASSGMVVLSTAGGRTAFGSTLLKNSSATAGAFNVSGETDAAFSISFSTGVTLFDSSGTHSMTVDAYVAKVGSTSDQASNYTGTLTTSPIALAVGGTLHVGTATSNPVGAYSTSNSGGVPLTVTVSYN